MKYSPTRCLFLDFRLGHVTERLSEKDECEAFFFELIVEGYNTDMLSKKIYHCVTGNPEFLF